MKETWIEYIKNHKSSGKLLDIGCGDGKILKKFQDSFETTGIDFSEKSVKKAKTNSPKSQIIFNDFLKHKFNRKFDIILALSLVHLFPKKEINSLFKKMKSLTKGDGIIVISATKPRFKELEIEKHFKTIEFFEKQSKWITALMKK